MSAPDLLVVIDPAARQHDAEAVRIVRDVLCAGSPGAKVCLPEGPEAVTRALARRGHRQPVIVGDDHALGLAVRRLHAECEARATRDPGAAQDMGATQGPRDAQDMGGGRDTADRDATLLACVPVGPPESLALARGLGLPLDVVSAARAVLGGVERPLGLLVDDQDVVVAGGLRIPAVPAQRGPSPEERTSSGVLGSLSRRAALVRPARRHRDAHGLPLPRLRVEADGVLLADPARPVTELSVSALADCARDGLAEVVVRQAASSPLGAEASAPSEVRVAARSVTVSGPDGATRTWRVAPMALRLTVP